MAQSSGAEGVPFLVLPRVINMTRLVETINGACLKSDLSVVEAEEEFLVGRGAKPSPEYVGAGLVLSQYHVIRGQEEETREFTYRIDKDGEFFVAQRTGRDGCRRLRPSVQSVS
jgi:hypothetical protein